MQAEAVLSAEAVHVAFAPELGTPPGWDRPAESRLQPPVPLEDLVQRLNALIEAERVIAKIAGLHLARGATRPELEAMARPLQRDALRACRLLRANIRSLGGTPSDAIGGSFEQAMAIRNTSASLALLGRCQRRVIRRLKDLLPQLPTNRLHADLLAMFAVRNLRLAETERARKALSLGRSCAGVSHLGPAD